MMTQATGLRHIHAPSVFPNLPQPTAHLARRADVKRFGTAFAWLWLINSLLTAGAFSMVWYQPWSNGSGIPETKCVLNGVSIPQVIEAHGESRSLCVGAKDPPR